MIYDIPGRTGLALAPTTIGELALHPRVVAVKDAKGDLFEAMSVMNAVGVAYYCGIDELNLPYLAAGATGVVSVVGAVAADRNLMLLDAVEAGDLEAARAVNDAVRPLTLALMKTAPGAATAKAALREIGVIEHASVRAPLLEATDVETAVVREALVNDGRRVRETLLAV